MPKLQLKQNVYKHILFLWISMHLLRIFYTLIKILFYLSIYIIYYLYLLKKIIRIHVGNIKMFFYK